MKIQLNQNLWDVSKTVFREKFVVLSVNVGKEERSKISKLPISWKTIKRKRQLNPEKAEGKKS